MDINLLRKVICGMQLGDSYLGGEKGILFIKEEFYNCFGNDIKPEEEKVQLEHHGWFLLKYVYLPKGYIISFEAELNSFNIRILNEDGGFIALTYLVKYENDLKGVNVRYAINKLKEVIEAELSFYKSMNNKLYKQVNGEYKRVNS